MSLKNIIETKRKSNSRPNSNNFGHKCQQGCGQNSIFTALRILGGKLGNQNLSKTSDNRIIILPLTILSFRESFHIFVADNFELVWIN